MKEYHSLDAISAAAHQSPRAPAPPALIMNLMALRVYKLHLFDEAELKDRTDS